MSKNIENNTREQIAIFLPIALKKAGDSYHEFMDKEIPQDSKKFSEHHAACKVAIAHVELLIKLARWADVEIQVPEDLNIEALYRESVLEIADFIEIESQMEDLA